MKFSQLSEEEDLGASGNQVVFRLLDAEVGGGGSRRKKISRFDFNVVLESEPPPHLHLQKNCSKLTVLISQPFHDGRTSSTS